MKWLMKSLLIKIYTVGKSSYFRLLYLKGYTFSASFACKRNQKKKKKYPIWYLSRDQDTTDKKYYNCFVVSPFSPYINVHRI